MHLTSNTYSVGFNMAISMCRGRLCRAVWCGVFDVALLYSTIRSALAVSAVWVAPTVTVQRGAHLR